MDYSRYYHNQKYIEGNQIMYTVIPTYFSSESPYPEAYRVVQVREDKALDEVCLLSDKAEADIFVKALNERTYG